MDIPLPLLEQAQRLGIALSHYDIDGHLIHANPDTLRYFVDLLTQDTEQIPDFDDVFLCIENEPINYPLERLQLNSPFSYQLFNEQQQLLDTQKNVPKLELSPLPFGYYQLIIKQSRQRYQVRLLVSPTQSYQPPVLNEKNVWGLNVQLYSLRSQKNWGIGDFADLRFLSQQAAKFGADFVGINPLHLLYPARPEWASPYSSSSRRWLNPIYLSIENLPEFKGCKTVQHWFKQQDIQTELQRLRQSEQVDYAAVMKLKVEALQLLFAYFKRSKAAQIVERREQFADYLQQQGQPLLQQGLFNVLDSQSEPRAVDDENHIGFLGWQSQWQQLSNAEQQKLIRQHYSQVQFWAWLQWLSEQQLSETQQHCLATGMKLGIYGDLAVSSSRGSVDLWADPSLFLKASVGAPPDPLGPIGQNWNLPPYSPTVLKNRGFQPIIEMLRANMQHFGVLRIDHIMGQFRLWLIPPEKTAAEGLYLHYPFAELMAILAIESQRNHCLLVGEDLGTVPDEVRAKLNELSIFSYFVLYFAQRHQQFPQAKNFPTKSYATIGTHDVPSLQSFWHCRDLELLNQLGILQGELLGEKYHQRVIDKQALLNSLHRDGFLPADYQGDALTMAMHDNLNRQIHRYLAESASQVIGIQLENLLSQEISFNLPGTSTEYPNWRKKLSLDLETMFESEHIQSFLRLIQTVRQHSKEQ